MTLTWHLVSFTVILFLIQYNEAQSDLTINLIPLGACNMTTYFRVGDSCDFQLLILIPPLTITDISIELISSITIDNGTNSSYSLTVAQLNRPVVNIGSNYNITNVGLFPIMTSSTSSSMFDQVDIQLGTVFNSNISQNTADNLITITFTAVVIDNGQADQTEMLVTSGIEYFNQTTIWIGQTQMIYNKTTVTEIFTTASLGSIDTITAKVANFGTFSVPLYVPDVRYFNLNLTASSSSRQITICSVHIMGANSSYSNLASVGPYISSKPNKVNNNAVLSLGNVINTGFNTNDRTSSYIYIFVAFKVSETAIVGSLNLNLQADIWLVSNPSRNLSLNRTGTVIINEYSPDSTVSPTPVIYSIINATPIPIYGSFNISVIVNFPIGFNNFVQIDAIPDIQTADGLPQVKICSIVVYSSGENVGCPKCMYAGTNVPYSQNSSLFAKYDSITFSVGSVLNYNLRSELYDNPYCNQMNFSIIGQVLNHTANINGANVSIPIAFTFGNETIWVSEGYVIVATTYSNYTNSSNVLFNMSVADAYSNSFTSPYFPRAVYFDIYTQPGIVYGPMDVEIVMPETIIGNGIPAGTICKAQIIYTGMYATCVQKEYINNLINYYQRMIQFKNDKAIISLDTFCNNGDPSIVQDPVDGLIRFLIYFQLEYDSTLVLSPTTYIAVGIQYTTIDLFVGQVFFTLDTGTIFPNTSMPASVYYYDNSSLSIVGGTYAQSYVVLKIPPLTNYGYALISSVYPPNGLAICTTKIIQRGGNVPCGYIDTHNYTYTGSLRTSDSVYFGPICSINNISATVNQTQVFDDDSVNIAIILRSSYSTSGTFNISYILQNFQTLSSVKSLNSTTVTVTPGVPNTSLPNYSYTNSSIINVNLNDPTSFIYVYNTTNNIFKGQTSIIRFNLTTIEIGKTFNFVFKISSLSPIDTFEIQKFFISNVGDNFPCITLQTNNSFINGSKYTSSISITLDDVSVYPINMANISASAITLDAYIRIPVSSILTAGTQLTFILNTSVNGVKDNSLSKLINLNLLDWAFFNSTIYSTTKLGSSNSNLNITAIGESLSVNIKQTIAINITLNIPPYSNLRTVIQVSAVDSATNRQFAAIQSIQILSTGRNVDGLMNEYNKNFFPLPIFSTKSPFSSFYYDNLEYDLGIITNTNYGLKQGNYNSVVDDAIILQCNVLIIDDPISQNATVFNLNTYANFNGQSSNLTSVIPIKIIRTGIEKPMLLLTASFLTNSFTQGSFAKIQFILAHDIISTAEAYNISVAFYFPIYVLMDSIIFQNSSMTFTKIDSAVFFRMDRLHFNQAVNCTFQVIIDPNNKYSTIINSYGRSPSSINIPYNVIFYSYNRNNGSNNVYSNAYKMLSYSPPTVSINSLPMNLLTLTNFQSCQVSSSVPGSLPMNAFIDQTGWTTGFRSLYYYTTGATYIKIAFGNLFQLSKLTIKQMSSDYAQFSKFQISYSNDDYGYSFFNEVMLTAGQQVSGAVIDYYIPPKTVSCRYLRIHLTDISNKPDLTTKQSGLIIKEIYGSTYSTPNSCPSLILQPSLYYQPRSYLYIPQNYLYIASLFICDETFDRSSSECYMSTDSNPNSWTVLPKIISTIVLYVLDSNTGSTYLYGVAKDRINYLRSDDLGFNWKAISTEEFDMMISTTRSNLNKIMYTYSSLDCSSIYPLGAKNPNSKPTTVSVSSSQWTIKYDGLYYGGILKFNWFN